MTDVDVTITRRTVLIYEFVGGDVLALRAPHRPAHIGLVREALADGRVLMAGAFGNEAPHGGMLVFASAEPDQAEAFAGTDPYVTNGVVADWRVEVWQTVA